MSNLSVTATTRLIQVVASLTEPMVQWDFPDAESKAQDWLKANKTSQSAVVAELERRHKAI